MVLLELLHWQWNGYSRYHRARTNLLVHIVAVPLSSGSAPSGSSPLCGRFPQPGRVRGRVAARVAGPAEPRPQRGGESSRAVHGPGQRRRTHPLRAVVPSRGSCSQEDGSEPSGRQLIKTVVRHDEPRRFRSGLLRIRKARAKSPPVISLRRRGGRAEGHAPRTVSDLDPCGHGAAATSTMETSLEGPLAV